MTDIDAPVNKSDQEIVVETPKSPLSGLSTQATPVAAETVARGAPVGPSAVTADPAAPAVVSVHVGEPQPPVAAPPKHRSRKWLLWGGTVAALVVGSYFLVPWIHTTVNTVSTDDAYVNGHVTYVASRVAGQVARVLVEDNQRVQKGDLLVQLDKEPFQVQVALKRDAVQVAEANLTAAESKARSLEALLGSQLWKLRNASEQVDAQIAQLQVQAATLRTQEATFDRARADYERATTLLRTHAISREDFDQREQQYRVAQASVVQAHAAIHQTRVALGLAPEPGTGQSLTDVPPNLNQTFSAVRTALSDCMQTLTELGQPLGATNLTPDQAYEEFRRLDQEGNIDKILHDLVPRVPAVLQAKATLEAARHDLEKAELDLRYTDIVSETDGVVVGRNVNPGNDVQAGQSLLTVRSLTEIWIDANFKETQLANLRIGQRVRCEVDMYGSRREFEGRITGFTMGTGQTLALLPPQNATGNFVKIVQRLPVRIELTDYDSDKTPLFVGLSVTPYVYYKEPPTGPHAGEILQPRKR
ncbi:MAG: HlyD family secretion protein [Planctomycetes bacterium]|nr:HlyD family secretion protein [Planctomycetota bacterium]